MVKKPLTTRLDEDVLALAKRLADAERRSMTAIIELAVIEYAQRRGVTVNAGFRSVGPEDEVRGGDEAPGVPAPPRDD